MCDTFVHTSVIASISAVAGVLAWLATNFFAEPLLSFYKRRRAIHESMLFAANVGQNSRLDVFLPVYQELRRHAAVLDAIEETSPALIRCWFRFRKYDLGAASAALIGFSNSLDKSDGSRGSFRRDLRQTLRFAREN